MKPLTKIDTTHAAPLSPQSDTTPVRVSVPTTLREAVSVRRAQRYAGPPYLSGGPPAPPPETQPAKKGTVLLALKRTSESTAETKGEITVTVDGKATAFVHVLEPAGPDSTAAGSGLRIPVGSYTVRRCGKGECTDAANRLIVEGEGLGKRTKIEFHAGNTADDTEGCVLPGTGTGANSVTHSRDAMRVLLEAIGPDVEATLTIESAITTGGGGAESKPTR